MSSSLPSGKVHLAALRRPLLALEAEVDHIDLWGRHLATVLQRGGRLLTVGNGGSAAQAQHLSSELVGRYRDDRPPFSALALHAETSALTAIANDYPPRELFARQVHAHGRPGDVLIALSTSGRSPNVLARRGCCALARPLAALPVPRRSATRTTVHSGCWVKLGAQLVHHQCRHMKLVTGRPTL